MASLLSYAGIPFCLDTAIVADWIGRNTPLLPGYQELPPPNFPGTNVSRLSRPQFPLIDVGVGQYYYPTGAQRWSVFRGLVDGVALGQMMAAALPASGAKACPFVVNCDGPTSQSHSLTTNLYMLAPRPFAVHGTAYPGLWMVTLVDERYYWQWPNQVSSTASSTWADLFTALALQLGITLTTGSVLSAYLAPEMDSQFWCNSESTALLLDAAAWNVGATVVRNLDGTYQLQRNAAAVAAVLSNRGTASKVERLAGADIIGNLSGFAGSQVAQAVLPQKVLVTFPRYVLSGGCPHFYSSRYTQTPRPSAWTEDSYGNVYGVTNTLASAGAPYSGFSGFPGTKVIRDTAKAIYATEASGSPTNATALAALALQLTQDYYAGQWSAALDETYPGTLAWQPEGIHDILWTYRREMASTRVFRPPWNYGVSEMQHSSGSVLGVGGRSVPLTVQDSSFQVVIGGVKVTPLWQGSWSSLPAYNVGDVVLEGAALYVCILTNTNETPPNGTYWQVYTNVIWLGVWSSSTAYVLDDGVSSGGVNYLCILGNTNQAPPNAAYWLPLVPGALFPGNVVYGTNLVTVVNGNVAPGLLNNGVQEALVTVVGDTQFTDYHITGIISLADQYLGEGNKWADGWAIHGAAVSGSSTTYHQWPYVVMTEGGVGTPAVAWNYVPDANGGYTGGDLRAGGSQLLEIFQNSSLMRADLTGNTFDDPTLLYHGPGSSGSVGSQIVGVPGVVYSAGGYMVGANLAASAPLFGIGNVVGGTLQACGLTVAGGLVVDGSPTANYARVSVSSLLEMTATSFLWVDVGAFLDVFGELDVQFGGVFNILAGGVGNVQSGGVWHINSGGNAVIDSGGQETVASGGNLNAQAPSGITMNGSQVATGSMWAQSMFRY